MGRRAIAMGGLTFVLALLLAFPAREAVTLLDLPFAVFSLFLVILTGILFDILGVAAAAAKEQPFHAMSAAHLTGAREALWIVRNADVVVTFCNDVIGDILGTVTGAAVAAIVFRITSTSPAWDEALLSIVMLALAAALTVGGKAAGKHLGLHRSTEMVLTAGRVLYLLARLRLFRLSTRKHD